MTHALDVRGLEKRYKGFALENIRFCVPAGFISGLIGPNGAGKTTVIKAIMNLIHADDGEVEVFGNDAFREGAAARSRIGYVPDEPKFFEDAKLADHVDAYRRFYDAWDDQRFEALAADFELPLRKRCKTLSQGMRTKFAIALALAHEPAFLIMDEPTSGLDPVFRKRLLAMLSDYISEGERSVLFSTHITSDLETTADYVTFLYAGRVVFSESLDSVHGRYAVVKGESVLPAGDSVPIVGSRTGTFGFEALTSDTNAFNASGLTQWAAEPATLEDIMYFTKLEEHHAGTTN